MIGASSSYRSLPVYELREHRPEVHEIIQAHTGNDLPIDKRVAFLEVSDSACILSTCEAEAALCR